jgi:hypothetical protein
LWWLINKQPMGYYGCTLYKHRVTNNNKNEF